MSDQKFWCLLVLLTLVGCSSERRGSDPISDEDAGPDAQQFPCAIPSQVVSDVTCAIPDQMCPGSCRRGLAGVSQVGSLTCRCMDVGTGFGTQWICDEATCEEDAGATDVMTMRMDAGITRDAAACPPARYNHPEAPACTTAQYGEIQALTSEDELLEYLSDPINADCSLCLSLEQLACATERSCGQDAGYANCCMEELCGADRECRQRAAAEECVGEVNRMIDCVNADAFCDWGFNTPPAICFP